MRQMQYFQIYFFSVIVIVTTNESEAGRILENLHWVSALKQKQVRLNLHKCTSNIIDCLSQQKFSKSLDAILKPLKLKTDTLKTSRTPLKVKTSLRRKEENFLDNLELFASFYHENGPTAGNQNKHIPPAEIETTSNDFDNLELFAPFYHANGPNAANQNKHISQAQIEK